MYNEVPGDVLQGLPGHSSTRQSLHQPLLSVAGLWDA